MGHGAELGTSKGSPVLFYPFASSLNELRCETCRLESLSSALRAEGCQPEMCRDQYKHWNPSSWWPSSNSWNQNGSIGLQDFETTINLLNNRLPLDRQIKDPAALFRKIDQDGNGSNDIEECGEAFRVSRILIVLAKLSCSTVRPLHVEYIFGCEVSNVCKIVCLESATMAAGLLQLRFTWLVLNRHSVTLRVQCKRLFHLGAINTMYRSMLAWSNISASLPILSKTRKQYRPNYAGAWRQNHRILSWLRAAGLVVDFLVARNRFLKTRFRTKTADWIEKEDPGFSRLNCGILLHNLLSTQQAIGTFR